PAAAQWGQPQPQPQPQPGWGTQPQPGWGPQPQPQPQPGWGTQPQPQPQPGWGTQPQPQPQPPPGWGLPGLGLPLPFGYGQPYQQPPPPPPPPPAPPVDPWKPEAQETRIGLEVDFFHGAGESNAEVVVNPVFTAFTFDLTAQYRLADNLLLDADIPW